LTFRSPYTTRSDDRCAGALLERALEGYRSAGDTYGIANCLGNLAVIGLRGGAIAVAAVNLRESLRLSSSIGDATTHGPPVRI